MGLLLFLLANLLGLLLLPIGILYGLFRSFYRRKFAIGLGRADEKLFFLAMALDKYGNSVCAELFNDTLLTKDSAHLFGRIEQTISLVIGLNLLAGTLSPAGQLLNQLLDFVDKDHTLKAVNAYRTRLAE